MKNFAVALGALVAIVATSRPSGAVDPVAGATVARSICAACHDISSAKPRQEQARAPAVPPAFYTIAQDPSHTSEWFRRFLRLPHGKMDNVLLTQADIDNVSAYILAMREPKR